MKEIEIPQFMLDIKREALKKWIEIKKDSDKKQEELEKKYKMKIFDEEEIKFGVEDCRRDKYFFNWIGESNEDKIPKKVENFVSIFVNIISDAHSKFYDFMEKNRFREYDRDIGFTVWERNDWIISINDWAVNENELEIEKKCGY